MLSLEYPHDIVYKNFKISPEGPLGLRRAIMIKIKSIFGTASISAFSRVPTWHISTNSKILDKIRWDPPWAYNNL